MAKMRMPTQQELMQMYSRVTILQKIVTLQHIHSLYIAAQQAKPPRKTVSFNILQLQKMINNNPLINSSFDFLNIRDSLSRIRQRNPHTRQPKCALSAIQIVQVIAETLAVMDANGKNEQIISQVPKTTVFTLSSKITVGFVKERLMKILNSYKNSTLKDITALEMNYKKKQKEITLIEKGDIPDKVLCQEFIRNMHHFLEQQKQKHDEERKLELLRKSATTSDMEQVSRKKIQTQENRASSVPATSKREIGEVSSNKEKAKEKPDEPIGSIASRIRGAKSTTSEELKPKAKEALPAKSAKPVKPVKSVKPAKSSAKANIEATKKLPKLDTSKHLVIKRKPVRKLEAVKQSELVSKPAVLSGSSSGSSSSSEEMVDASMEIKKEDTIPSSPTHKRSRSEADEEDLATQRRNKRFQMLSVQLISQVSSNRFASMFLQPVNSQEEPQYYSLVKKPVDLKTLVKEVRAGTLTSFEELEFKLQLMFSNAIMYNDVNEQETYRGIVGMMEESQNLLNMFKETIKESKHEDD